MPQNLAKQAAAWGSYTTIPESRAKHWEPSQKTNRAPRGIGRVMSDKRLAFLEQTVAAGSTDPLALYGLAQEYRGRGRFDDALAAFEKLRAAHADYVPQYLMAGQMLHEAGKNELAATWLDAGIAAAQRTGNTHALSELTSLRNAV